jgi:DNA-binding transcriptional ArsR family regulator
MKDLAEERADIYRIFSNAKRLHIFWLLLEKKEWSVNDLAEAIDTSIQNTSQHLRLMKAKSILTTRRNGKEIYYRIADTENGQFCRYIHETAIPPKKKRRF